MLLSSAIDLFISSVCAGKQNETPTAYRVKLNRLLAFLGDLHIETIGAGDLERFRQALLTQSVKKRGALNVKAPLSVWYVRGVLRVVKHFFRWCADQGHLPGDIGGRLKIPKRPQVLPKAIDPAVFNKLLDAAAVGGDMWARARDVAFLCLLRDSGGRLSGLLKASIDDVDLYTCTLTVTEKGKARVLFFHPVTRAALERWIEVRSSLPVRSVALFIGRRGDGLSRSGVYGMLRRLAERAGVEGARVNPHSFRHAFARDSLRAGADLSEVSQLMGHSTIAVTGDYYARWLPSELQEVHKLTSPGASMKDVLAQ
jgi:site-specific recombinase XerD